ncbi:deoxyribose-phosphate aldolase [Calidifontibacter sp. DB0510]|uniref:Deoxyribose-phosphate aldolase n=1 Tax=Metallococcus carri TaxID=1656884 RepID=A0A967AXQ7_9MICO|nr:deoxyribose-phosphate aldolase [Metallococcus carri]NHN54929.1 deoxyribose-phosphate aldolase [Metallococcus carri]NOP37275.1 deoxyribose-phosphate aldolase [Calidifontibacter sp. DB2511S]
MNLDRLARVRRHNPGAIDRAWAARRRRPLLAPDGRMLVVAADHMARGALGVRDDPVAMASRPDLLRRLAVALSRPGVDGVLGTADVLEDLLLAGLLDDKLVFGSMNRGGLQGASFELDDRATAYTADQIAARGLDGGKMLVRICLDDPGTVTTLSECARSVDQLAAHRLPAMIEPFWSIREAGRVINLLDAESVIRSVNVVSGLGSTSAYTWLKLPVVPDMERVLAATTLPVLMLGGDPREDPEATYAVWAAALAQPTAAGLVVGRALLYPPDGDVGAAVDIAASLVHG